MALNDRSRPVFRSMPAALFALLFAGAAVGPVPELTFIAQFTGVGVLIGSLVALYGDRRFGPDADRRFRTVTAWTAIVTLLGVAVYVGFELVRS